MTTSGRMISRSKKQLLRLAELANVSHSIQDDTTSENIATWIEQSFESTVRGLEKRVDELEAVKDALIAADEDYGPTDSTTPAEVVKRILAERDELQKRVGALKTLGDVEDEILRLRKQVDELQIANTRLLEERRAVDERYMVEQFHRVMGVPVAERPEVPAEKRVQLRLRLIAEEFEELLQSCCKNEEAIDNVNVAIEDAVRCVDLDLHAVDLLEFADACADLKYVIVGAELEFGIDGRPVFAGVHEANMKKKDGPVRDDGKRLKPPNWKPFDVGAELRRQGWRAP